MCCFQFDPPLLEGVELTVRGHFDQKLQAFFVYEVHGISHLVCNAPAAVEFIDPGFVEKRSGSGRAVLPGSLSVPELEIDDDQAPDADHSEMRLDAPMVSFEFANSVQTTRIGKLAGSGRGIIRVEDGASPSSEARLEVSTEGTCPL